MEGSETEPEPLTLAIFFRVDTAITWMIMRLKENTTDYM